jgi:hypothetical protein
MLLDTKHMLNSVNPDDRMLRSRAHLARDSG